jgi:hypothetical protein
MHPMGSLDADPVVGDDVEMLSAHLESVVVVDSDADVELERRRGMETVSEEDAQTASTSTTFGGGGSFASLGAGEKAKLVELLKRVVDSNERAERLEREIGALERSIETERELRAEIERDRDEAVAAARVLRRELAASEEERARLAAKARRLQDRILVSSAVASSERYPNSFRNSPARHHRVSASLGDDDPEEDFDWMGLGIVDDDEAAPPEPRARAPKPTPECRQRVHDGGGRPL